MSNPLKTIIQAIRKRREDLGQRWMAQLTEGSSGAGRISDSELRGHTADFLELLLQAAEADSSGNVRGADWAKMRAFLKEISRSRAVQGFTSSQTASFIFSLKKPLFSLIQEELQNDPGAFAECAWAATDLVDQLGLLTVAAFQETREEIIARQQEEMLELSTPVVTLWEGVLALPMIGTLDTARTQTVMETLLQRIVETGSQIAIVDITGVPTVDTLVAQHLIQTASAIRLMGAECIVSGVRPQIAQTIVHLGVDLGEITTKASLADALSHALRRSGWTFSKKA